MKIKHREPYGPLRAKEYPEISDQLDAIFKMAEALKDQGVSLPDDTLKWIENCRKVKDKYRKNS